MILTQRIDAKKSGGETIRAILGDVRVMAGSDENQPKRFEVLAYTGGLLEGVRGFEKPVVVDLAGMSFAKNIVANLDHDRTRRVGHVTQKEVVNGQLVLAGVASAATDARREVVESAAAGFSWQASIEANPTGLRFVKDGETIRANGQTFKGPLYYAPKSILRGFAFVGNGADEATSVTIAADGDGDPPTMSDDCRRWIEGLGFTVDSLSAEQARGLVANFRGLPAPPRQDNPPPPDPPAGDLPSAIAAQRAETERTQRITSLTVNAMQDHPLFAEDAERLANEAIQGNWTVDRFELELLRRMRPQAHTVIGRQRHHLTNDVLEAALCISGGLEKPDDHFNEETLNRANDRFRNGLGLQELMIIGAQDNGHRGLGTQITLDVQRAAFGLSRRPGIEASGFSTLSIPNILSNTANKFLLQGWMAVDRTWAAISSRRSVRDFKQISSYSLTGSFSYEEVGPGGELKHGTVGEETYNNQAVTYGRMFAITRTDLINDDLGALTAVPRRLGRGAALKLNNIFWTAFLNNSAFFTAGRANVSTGTGSALSSAGLSAAEVVFMNQTDPDSEPLGIMAAILLVPPTLKRTALELMNSSFVVSGTDARVPSSNTFQGSYSVQSSPYMENSSYTGNSTAAWYLLANPADLSTIEVAFLNGRESPVVETADADFNVLGVQMRGYHDFGVATQEYRAGVRSAGS